MLSFSSFILELYDMGIAHTIDGCLYAPVEQIVYGFLRYEFTLTVIILAVLFLVAFASCGIAALYRKYRRSIK